MSRYQMKKNKFLTEAEEQRLIKSLENANERDRLLIMLALKTGARATELLNISIKDMDPQDRTVHIKGLKGSDDREIPIPTSLFKRLHNYAKASGGAKIFNMGYDNLDRIWNLYRPNGKKFHSLRHTFAMRLFERTQNLRLVQICLGHRSIGNTMIYADYHYKTSQIREFLGDDDE